MMLHNTTFSVLPTCTRNNFQKVDTSFSNTHRTILFSNGHLPSDDYSNVSSAIPRVLTSSSFVVLSVSILDYVLFFKQLFQFSIPSYCLVCPLLCFSIQVFLLWISSLYNFCSSFFFFAPSVMFHKHIKWSNVLYMVFPLIFSKDFQANFTAQGKWRFNTL